MTKNEFLNELQISLKRFSKKETDQVINYYNEMINDRMENTMKSEAEIIESFGKIQDIKAQISADLIDERLKDKESKNNIVKSSKNLTIILMLLLASPALLPAGVGLLAAVIALVVAALSIAFSLGVSSIGVMIAAIPNIIELVKAQDSAGLNIIIGNALMYIGLSGFLAVVIVVLIKKFIVFMTGVCTKLINKYLKRGINNEN